jgi:hypothetical protein
MIRVRMMRLRMTHSKMTSMATASMLMCAHVRRGLLRETADFVAKFKDGFEAGLVAADLLKKLRKRREDL